MQDLATANYPLDPVAGVPVNQVRSAFTPPAIAVSVELIAKMCHEVNRVWCQAMGDDSQLPWDQAPDWQRNSAIEGVTFHVNSPATTPRDSHMNWLRTKQNEGWSWGPVKDPAKKQHHCFCSYENLPWDQQVKDHLFFAVVKSLQPLLPTEMSRKFDKLKATQTEGERIAGISFNPSFDWRIDFMKGMYAELYDFINRFTKEKSTQSDLDNFALVQVGRSSSIAKTDLQNSKMHFVEAITR